MSDENDDIPFDASESVGGNGGTTRRAESNLPVLTDSRLTSLAIRKGWLKGDRWGTDLTRNDLIRIREQRDLTFREEALLAAFDMVKDDNKRVKSAGVKAAVSMERQNQNDQLFTEPQASGHLHLHQGDVRNTVVVMPDNSRKTIEESSSLAVDPDDPDDD